MKRNRPRTWVTIGCIYAALVALSFLAQGAFKAAAPGDAPRHAVVELERVDRNGVTGDDPIRLAFVEWTPGTPRGAATILIHGSPGTAANFDSLGPRLARDGRRAFALDMPGFGDSTKLVPDYSARAYARTLLAFMDAQAIERAHLVGWSNGGAVILNAADLAPDRVASLTMLGAIGLQDTEGSGSFVFEKLKYAAGYAALVALPEALPHFGLLGPRSMRHAFIRNFLDTDQRPLGEIMHSLDTPTLILHGRNDFLISDWAAERHHAAIPTSRLTMTPHGHFLPVMQPEQTASFLVPFLERHDTPGVRAQSHTADLAPVRQRNGFAGFLDDVGVSARDWHWWLVVPIVALLTRFRPETTTALLGWFVASMSIDFGVAYVGVLVGRVLTPLSAWQRPGGPRAALRAVTDLVWSGAALLIAQAIMGSETTVRAGGPGWIALLVVTAAVLRVVRALPTRTGRIRLRTSISKWTHHEWWPPVVLYLPLVPHLLGLARRHRSLLAWTAANPGVAPDDGIMGESKSDLLGHLSRHPSVLPWRVIEADGTPEDRASRAHAVIESDAEMGGYPIVCKPDVGERGRGVALVTTEDELHAWFGEHPERAMLHRYHPGPVEAGVFWVRRAETVGREHDTEGPHGFVFAITRKTLPEVTGDGRSSLRRLVENHPRYRKQMKLYADRFGRAFDTIIPDEGAAFRLSDTGNHVRGCLFEDGADLITPELGRTTEEIIRAYRGPKGEPYDFGRFDLRAESEDALKRGDFRVIELNGTTSEATNLYDPNRSTRWAYGVLYRQWDHVFELGARRAKHGTPVVTWKRLREIVRDVAFPGRRS
jgi:pimeloyl-ACP methyl ester carboxylesterase